MGQAHSRCFRICDGGCSNEDDDTGLREPMLKVETSLLFDASVLSHLTPYLKDLAPGSEVAIISYRGSFCPVTKAHIQSIGEARDILVGAKAAVGIEKGASRYAACVAFMQANAEGWLAPKLKEQGEDCLSRSDREHLIRLATAESPWIQTLNRVGDGFKPNTADTLAAALELLQKQWPALRFQVWWLNGADDVVKYKKWEKAGEDNRLITMGRPGDTQAVIDAIAACHTSPRHFLLGPELPDVSSTKVRQLLRAKDSSQLATMLTPRVAEWCLEYGPYQPR